jgi:hypothetical protein
MKELETNESGPDIVKKEKKESSRDEKRESNRVK